MNLVQDDKRGIEVEEIQRAAGMLKWELFPSHFNTLAALHYNSLAYTTSVDGEGCVICSSEAVERHFRCSMEIWKDTKNGEKLSLCLSTKWEVEQCSNYRRISLLSMVGKIHVYARVVCDRLRLLTDEVLMNEQGGFSVHRGCVDQMFAVR